MVFLIIVHVERYTRVGFDSNRMYTLNLYTNGYLQSKALFLDCSEDEYTSSPVSVLDHELPFETESNTNVIRGIGEHVNNPHALEKTGLKWPFVGNRFDHVQWKSGIAGHKIATTQTVKRKKWTELFPVYSPTLTFVSIFVDASNILNNV